MFCKTVLTPIFQTNNIQQRLQVEWLISDFTICTVYFPIVNNSYPKFHINTTHLKQGRILQNDFTAHFGHVTYILSEMVDLPKLKAEQGIPEPYSSSTTLTSFNFKFLFRKETLYSRLFTLTSQKTHNSAQFALINLTNIPTPYNWTRGTHWLSSDSHWSILQTPSTILQSSIHQEDKNNFKIGSMNRIQLKKLIFLSLNNSTTFLLGIPSLEYLIPSRPMLTIHLTQL